MDSDGANDYPLVEHLMAIDNRYSTSVARLPARELRLSMLGASFVTFLLATALAYLLFGDSIRASNVRDTWLSPEADYLAAAIGALVIAILLLCAPLASSHRAALLILWAAKTATTLGLMLIFEAHYEVLDAFTYHELAVDSFSRFTDSSWGSGGFGTELVIWLLQLAYLLVPSSYHLAKVIFSSIGLVGIYLTWRGVILLTGREKLRDLFLIGLFPSLLFWSSILGKDPLLVLTVGMFVFGVAKLHQKHNRSALALMLSAAVLASLVRLWMGAILVLPALLVFLTWRVGAKKHLVLVLGAVAAAVTLLLATAVLESLGGDVAGLILSIDDLSQSWSEGGSQQSLPQFASGWGLLAFSPLGAFTALFRPLPGEVGGPFGFVAGLENAIFLIAFALSVSRLRREHLLHSSFLILAAVMFTWAFAYGVVSYQNLGTASRYRAQILPVVLPLVIILWYRVPREKAHPPGKVRGDQFLLPQ